MEGELLMEHLSTLTEGDEVILTTLWGEDLYRVSGVAVIAPDDITSVMIQLGRELLTLLSCHPYASGGKYRFLAICEKKKKLRWSTAAVRSSFCKTTLGSSMRPR